MKKAIRIACILLIGAFGFRLFLALRHPNDEPDDGRVYALIARDVVDHHAYSLETDAPYKPTFIRVPGYPLFLAGIYRLFGEDNNRAVRIAQAVLSTLTCLIVGLIAVVWSPSDWDENRRRRALLVGIALAAICPFTAIYVSLILTETWATMLGAACALAASLAIKSEAGARKIGWWAAAGVLGGGATMFRPDAAMFVGAAGILMVLVQAGKAVASAQSSKTSTAKSARRRLAEPLKTALVSGTAITLGFGLALTPWTIRNARVFGMFQPIAPSDAGMPGEFSYQGYIAWLKTWVDDVRYTEIAEWPLDYAPIRIQDLPDFAFDSHEERDRVAALLAAYNNGADKQDAAASDSSDDDDSSDASNSPDATDDHPDTPPPPEQVSPNQVHTGKEYAVQMTTELDASFAEIARERIARRPFRYYVTNRLKRASSMWFDTHSQYYPFQGELLPLSGLDTDLHQQYWLPAFMLLTLLYTILMLAGCVIFWRDKQARVWLLFLALLTLPRIAFLSTLENPEPRYVVELFAFLAAASAIAVAAATPSTFLAKAPALLRRRSQKQPLPPPADLASGR
jgi:4-amino-4-deoxy-L-arabinose transferase-like glycosyltransferase